MSIVSSHGTKVKECRTVNSFCVISDDTGTKNFTSLQLEVPRAERMSLNGSKPFLGGLYTLADP